MSKQSWIARLLGRGAEGEDRARASLVSGEEAALPPAESVPTDAAGWKKRGLALRGQERYEEALACFDRGLEIDPRNWLLWNNKGAALKALGRTDEADACLRRANELGSP